MLVLARVSSVVGMCSGGLLALGQVVPVPEDLKTWPATAVLGLITMAALTLVFFCVKSLFKAAQEHNAAQIALAHTQGEFTEVLRETNQTLGELCSKLGRRPCLKD